MRALAIAPQPFFSPRGTPLSVYYRAMVTARQGVKVDLLTYGQGQDVDIPGVRIIRIPKLAFLGPVRVGPSWVKLLLDQFMIVWTIALLLRRRYDFVHAHEEAVFWCRFLKPIFRFKLVYDMHSSLPQQLTNFRFTRSRLLIGLFEKLERTCLRKAEAVITICPDLKDYALKMGVDPEKHVLIENSIFDDVNIRDPQSTTSATDTATVSSASSTAALAVHGPADRSVDAGARNGSQPAGSVTSAAAAGRTDGPLIVYAGTFESYQGVDTLIRAFGQVVASRSDAHLLMVGGAEPQVHAMRDLASKVGLNGHCTFTGTVPKSQAMAYTRQADVLVSPRREGTNTPLKVYEQLASGKPLVATRIWSHTQVLSDEVCFLVEPEPESMARGILAAIEDEPRRAQVVAGARALYETHYSRAAYEAKMQRLLEILR